MNDICKIGLDHLGLISTNVNKSGLFEYFKVIVLIK